MITSLIPLPLLTSISVFQISATCSLRWSDECNLFNSRILVLKCHLSFWSCYFRRRGFCAVLPNLFLAVVTEDPMVSPNFLFVSVVQSHPVGMCMDCFGSRGECAVIAVSLQTCHCSQTEGRLWLPKWWALLACLLDCLTLGGLTKLWVLGWTIAFTRDGFLGLTDPPIKKLFFSSLTKHFPPPCTHYSVIFK